MTTRQRFTTIFFLAAMFTMNMLTAYKALADGPVTSGDYSNGETLFMKILTPLIVAVVMGVLNAVIVINVVKTHIGWLKEILMSRPCLDRRGNRDDNCGG